jgi:MoxR-like ATPase
MSRHAVIRTPESEYWGRQDLPDKREIDDLVIDRVTVEPTVQQRVLVREPYLPDPRLVEVVNLAIATGRPLLLQGDPGCGKSRLAYAVAYELGLPIEECYIKSTSRAQDLLYTYDAVNRLYDAQLGADGPQDPLGKPLSRAVRNYVRLGPLGRAIARAQFGRRSVVLIDEIDKADLDFPNDLLLELDRLWFRVSEDPEIYFDVPGTGSGPDLRPIVIVTHNEEKALPDPFLRRCIFHYVEFPGDEPHLLQILALHRLNDVPRNERAVEVIVRLRNIVDLDKKPGLSELIDWAGYLQAVNAPIDSIERIPYVGALLKTRLDQQRRHDMVSQTGNVDDTAS